MGQYVVIADDLTGALDTAIQFTSGGAGAVVLRYRPEDVDALLRRRRRLAPDAAVAVVDIASRHLPPDQAAARVQATVAAARTANATSGDAPPRFYKKTDSALRGNIGAELDALLSASGADVVCFVPAHPALGRTTVDGVHLIDGQPLGTSEFARDARQPVKLSSVPVIISQQTTVPVQTITTRQVYAGETLQRVPRRIVVCDAATAEDLRAAGRWLKGQEVRYEPAGCGGFASEISNVWDVAEVPDATGTIEGAVTDEPEAPECASRGMLVVCGSRHRRSRDQVRAALDSKTFTLNRTADARFGVIVSDNVPVGDPDSVAWSLADTALKHMRADPPAVLTVFGGDTAAAVLDAMEVRTIRPVYEYDAGVVVSAIDSGVLPETRLLVTKAGGFGGERLLVEMHRQFEWLVRRGIRCTLR